MAQRVEALQVQKEHGPFSLNDKLKHDELKIRRKSQIKLLGIGLTFHHSNINFELFIIIGIFIVAVIEPSEADPDWNCRDKACQKGRFHFYLIFHLKCFKIRLENI